MKKLLAALLFYPMALLAQGTPPNCVDTGGQHLNYTSATHAWACGTSTGAAGSIVVGNPISGGGANRVLYEDASQNLAASATLTFTPSVLSLVTDSGQFTFGATPDVYLTRKGAKQLMISGDGTGATTNAGIIAGYSGTSGQGAIWSSTITPDGSNYALKTSGSATLLNGTNSVSLAIGNTVKLDQVNTAGAGPAITAGTATNDVAALSVTRTNNNSAVATGVKFAFTDTTSAAGFKPLEILGGSSATTSLLAVDKSGNLAIGGTTITAALGTDAATTNNTVCLTTTTNVMTKGSGAAGICLGTSSERFKTSITTLEPGLKEILSLRPVSYYTDAEHGDATRKLYGFTAEQGGSVLPELMRTDAEGRPNQFDYMGVVPVLVKAIQQQDERIRALEAKLEALAPRVAAQ